MNSVPPPPSDHRLRKRRRSRRLRKKLRIGEFRELGFEIALRLVPDLAAEEDDAFWQNFIVECIEARGLTYGGASTGTVARAGRGSVSAEDRKAVQAWLAARPELACVEVGPLDDVWYPAHAAPMEASWE
jgi:uncharacterized protein YggL (DUF469 family)